MLANLRALFGVIADIVLLRRGPESLPASSLLLAIVLVVHLAVYAATVIVVGGQQALWPLQLAFSTVLTLLTYQITFAIVKKRERFLQTMIAVFATFTLFVPVIVPILVTFTQAKKPEEASFPLVLLMFGILIWILAVQVRILKSAFEWPIPGIIGFLFAQEFVVAAIHLLVFGAPSPSA